MYKEKPRLVRGFFFLLLQKRDPDAIRASKLNPADTSGICLAKALPAKPFPTAESAYLTMVSSQSLLLAAIGSAPFCVDLGKVQ
jgi:hypothetical protein